ncbi:MAG: DUF1385 domain-containing protein [Actinobacteria bacterium]|nr:DUF1385 domain-containing protein [Actinomycetota bacterium]
MASDDDALAYYGGQAVIEGVMMRGTDAWAVAVRRPSGQIYLERHATSDLPKRVRLWRLPLLRGMFALVDALRVGTRALTISANESVDDDEQMSPGEFGGGMLLALVAFVGVFVVLPNLGLAPLRDAVGDGLVYHLIEGLIRVAIFLAYLTAIAMISDIRRTFAYHGAEHQTIAAWEHGDRLEPDAIGRYSTKHVRCGTNFLVMVMLIAIVVYSVAGALLPPPGEGIVAGIVYHVLLRIALLPLVAGLAYEGLRLGAGRDNWLVRALMKPGIWLQYITTRPSDPQMVEVAIRAFEAVAPPGQLDGRVPASLPSTIVWGPDDFADARTTADPAEEPAGGA